jgi:hypothetical protein
MGRSYGLSAEWLDITLYDDPNTIVDKKHALQERYMDVWTWPQHVYTLCMKHEQEEYILEAAADVIVA